MPNTAVPKVTQLLPPEELAVIQSLATRRKYRDGEIIHERGDNQPEIGIVISGRIKLVYPRSSGQDVFSGLIHTGQNYGDVAVLHQLERPHRAVAIGDTVVDHIVGEAFNRLLQRPAIVEAFYRVASYRLAVALEMLDDMRMLAPDVRLAKLIIRMHNAAGGTERLAFIQEDFASILGISSVTLAKSLRELKQQGLVATKYRQLVIMDLARLKAWVREKDPD